MVYYNEFDAKKAAWLRELIARDLIAPGVVDERSIRDVQPGDLAGYAQCHFFAGIGIWSYALRLAGWPDDRPIWTASCPCQPFSAAGRRKGTADERHLWPELFRLIRECRPIVAIGEQVAGSDGLAWLDIVRSDLDECLYTCGHVVSPACGYGAPHRRERLYWVALSDAEGRGRGKRGHASLAGGGRHTDGGCEPDGVADSAGAGPSERRDGREPARAQRAATERDCGADRVADGAGTGSLPCSLAGVRGGKDGGGARHGEPERSRHAGSLGYSELPERGTRERESFGHRRETGRDKGSNRRGGSSEADGVADAGRSTDARGLGWDAVSGLGATRGFWAGANWVLTRPQRVGDPPSLRPIEPGSFPLADGAPARVVRLRGYGDAIVAPQAAAFIRAVMEEL